MNEFKKYISIIFMSFLVGSLFTGVTVYRFTMRSSADSDRQYRERQSELETNNRELETRLRIRQDYYNRLQKSFSDLGIENKRLESNCTDLENRLRQRQGYIDEAGQIIEGTGTSLQKLREIILLIKKIE